MISWRSPLFSTKLAHEVRRLYRQQIQSGTEAEKVTAWLIKWYCSQKRTSESAAIFWMALAAVQLEHRQLQPDVRKQAIAWINRVLTEPPEQFSAMTEDDICACRRDICALKCWILEKSNEAIAKQS